MFIYPKMEVDMRLRALFHQIVEEVVQLPRTVKQTLRLRLRLLVKSTQINHTPLRTTNKKKNGQNKPS